MTLKNIKQGQMKNGNYKKEIENFKNLYRKSNKTNIRITQKTNVFNQRNLIKNINENPINQQLFKNESIYLALIEIKQDIKKKRANPAIQQKIKFVSKILNFFPNNVKVATHDIGSFPYYLIRKAFIHYYNRVSAFTLLYTKSGLQFKYNHFYQYGTIYFLVLVHLIILSDKCQISLLVKQLGLPVDLRILQNFGSKVICCLYLLHYIQGFSMQSFLLLTAPIWQHIQYIFLALVLGCYFSRIYQEQFVFMVLFFLQPSYVQYLVYCRSSLQNVLYTLKQQLFYNFNLILYIGVFNFLRSKRVLVFQFGFTLISLPCFLKFIILWCTFFFYFCVNYQNSPNCPASLLKVGYTILIVLTFDRVYAIESYYLYFEVLRRIYNVSLSNCIGLYCSIDINFLLSQ